MTRIIIIILRKLKKLFKFGISKPFLCFIEYHSFQGIIPNTIIVEALSSIVKGLVMSKNKTQYMISTMVNPNIEYGPNNKPNVGKDDNSKWIELLSKQRNPIKINAIFTIMDINIINFRDLKSSLLIIFHLPLIFYNHHCGIVKLFVVIAEFVNVFIDLIYYVA